MEHSAEEDFSTALAEAYKGFIFDIKVGEIALKELDFNY